MPLITVLFILTLYLYVLHAPRKSRPILLGKVGEAYIKRKKTLPLEEKKTFYEALKKSPKNVAT